MTPFRNVRRLLPLLLLIPLLPLPVLLTAAPQEKPDKFEETSQVVAVEVPVNVIDRDGKPVRGLTAADFEVFDQGDPQSITGFEVVDLAQTAPAGAEPAAPPPIPRSASARRHFLLLFDLSYSSPTAILKARLAAREFLLGSLHPQDVAAVATFSVQRGPRLVVAFTPDRAQLARAIDTLGLQNPNDPTVERDPLRLVIEPPAESSMKESIASGGDSDIRDTIRAQRDQAALETLKAAALVADQSERSFAAGRISGFSRAMGDMARALSAIQGRKQVIYFSEGFDGRLLLGRTDTGGQDSEQDTQNIMRGQSWMVDNDNRYGNTGLQNDIKRMLQEFQRADCVIQSIDIGGLRADAGSTTRASGQESLFYLANETGGELFRNANDFRDQLERVLEHTSVTYILTFERSDLKTDGAFHRLKVKAKDLPSGARLSYRAGYYAPRPFKELDPLEKNLLASDGIVNAVPRRDVEMSVLATPFRSTPERAYVPVIIEIPGRTLLAGHRGDKLKVEFFTYASDSMEQMQDFFSQMVTLDLAKGRAALEKTGIKYYGHLDLPPGKYRLRVLVRNAETGRTGIESVPVSVPSYEEAQSVLLPPFFMEDRQGWVMVREKDSESLDTKVVYPFTVKGEPYVPAARPVLEGERSASLCLVAYNLGQGDLNLEGKVRAADGQSLPAGRLSLVERTSTGINGLDKLLATFDPKGLKAGSYVLEVAVKNPATGRQEASSLPFTIR